VTHHFKLESYTEYNVAIRFKKKVIRDFLKLFLNPIFNNPMLKYDPNLNDMLEKE
jgi:hypothetical protein